MKKGLSASFWAGLVLFGLMGQVAWVVENMYFNVFIYKQFSATPSDISLMVGASAVSATLTTVFMGALSDKLGKRKAFIAVGYILWGISIISFCFIRSDIISRFAPISTVSAIGIGLVVIMDCVMTFFGSTANDAAFNAWVTDSTPKSALGKAEGINSMMPLIAILAVFGGFMSFNLDSSDSWTKIFLIIGGIVLIIGVLGIFLIKEPKISPSSEGYFKTVFYGFSRSSLLANKPFYLCLGGIIIFNIAIQIFMPYLIIYYEMSLGMKNYVLIMAPAIILASGVTAAWGRVYDKKGFKFSSVISLLWLATGFIILYFTRSAAPVFIGSLLMMSGYLSGMAVFGALLRDTTPQGKAGRLQGIRIFSQVLVPGVIGPYIGKTVLAGADTVISSDGTSSFLPSADIFAAALVPAVLLLLVILLIKSKPKSGGTPLKTPYTPDEIPHNYHPTPSFKRDSFLILNGEWDLKIERGKKTQFDGKILVPFPPESSLSGVGRITDKRDTLIYERELAIPQDFMKGRLFLHFGAVDCDCEIYLGNSLIGKNSGGYLPFSFDITEHINRGEDRLRVRVFDPLSHRSPYGKQRHKRGGMWYTPISGIWQTVWLEARPENYISSIKVTPTLSSVSLEVLGGESEKLLKLEGREYPFSGDKLTLRLDNARLWTPEQPNIYEFSILSGEDEVHSYFALRNIGIDYSSSAPRLTLNGKPYFFHGLLDQGYFSDGIFMPASEKGFVDDILNMKRLGFNMLRKHIKIEPEIFYYYCDIYGMAVFQDMVNAGRYSFLYDTALPTLGLKALPKHQCKSVRESFLSTAQKTLQRLYNHPSVLYYTIFNEGWGQFSSDEAYLFLKALDETRIFDTASGWFRCKKSDVESEHIYFKPAKFKLSPSKPTVLSEFGGYSLSLSEHCYNPQKTYGYKICKTQAELSAELEKLYFEEVLPLKRAGLSASVLTQLSDIEDETNGIITYDRRVIKPDEEIMQKIAAALKE